MTNVLITIEQRYDRTPDGRIWAAMDAYPFWQRYLAVFDHVRVLARVRDVSSAPPDWVQANGDRVTFTAVPYYLGPVQYLRKYFAVNRAVRAALRQDEAVILRVDSQIAACLFPALRRSGVPYGVEVVTDPYDMFAPGGIEHPFRPFFRWKFTRELKQQCTGACAASYVTADALQRRYPPRPGGFTTHYSSVELPEAAFAASPHVLNQARQCYQLVTTAYLVDSRKGIDVLLDALAVCRSRGLDFSLAVIGEGRLRPLLEDQAGRLGLASSIRFLGHLPTAQVRAQLDAADLFILPSRGEGLPRALIEAMARGLPAIGSSVGGFPELLSAEYLVPPGEIMPLAKIIGEVLADPGRLNEMARRNLQTARGYHRDILQAKRNVFYQHLRAATIRWNTLHLDQPVP